MTKLQFIFVQLIYFVFKKKTTVFVFPLGCGQTKDYVHYTSDQAMYRNNDRQVTHISMSCHETSFLLENFQDFINFMFFFCFFFAVIFS